MLVDDEAKVTFSWACACWLDPTISAQAQSESKALRIDIG
jgi:hypothetical protein